MREACGKWWGSHRSSGYCGRGGRIIGKQGVSREMLASLKREGDRRDLRGRERREREGENERR